MKKIFCILFLLPLITFAQKVTTHVVAAKESFTSIGRLYNINGRELANFNKIDYDKGLTLGQVLKIPATATPPVNVATPPTKQSAQTVSIQKVEANVNTNGTPIYHTVTKKETLYHISSLYNKVPVDDIKKWNHLTSDGVSEGTQLIVGYSAENTPIKSKTETKIPEIVKDEPKKIIPKKEIPKEIPKEVPKEVPNEIAKANKYFDGGLFKNLYSNNGEKITETGTAGIFKSTSGFADGKYYCLHNSAPQGTIIKITNTATGKIIYAKVLDVMPDVKQNNNLIIRISNAAAYELEAGETNFNCSINYPK